jgi:hypothetical protein
VRTKRYVLFKPAHAGEVAESDLSRISSSAMIVDSIGSRAFLVDASEDSIGALKHHLDGWTIEEERAVDLPREEPE